MAFERGCPWCGLPVEQVWTAMETWDTDGWRCDGGHRWATNQPVQFEEAMEVILHQPQIFTDGGPWAMHDQACAICQERHAVLNLSCGVFEPCGQCQAAGWELSFRRRGWRWRARHWWTVAGRIDLQMQKRK